MRIYSGSGTPIWLSSRNNDDGVLIHQGRSHIMLSDAELPQFIAALQELVKP